MFKGLLLGAAGLVLYWMGDGAHYVWTQLLENEIAVALLAALAVMPWLGRQFD